MRTQHRGVRQLVWVEAFAVALVVAGCNDAASPPTPLGKVERQTSFNVRRAFSTIDDRYAALTSDVPGFGGLFYDSSGVLTIYLKDPHALGSARFYISAFMAKETRRSPRALERISRDVGLMRVRHAKYDFRELLGLYRAYVVPAVAVLDGVTLTDVDDRENRIVVGVMSATEIGRVRQALAGLPIPIDLVSVIQVNPQESQRSMPGPVESRVTSATLTNCTQLTLNCRPIPGGVQVQYTLNGDFNCTLGYNLVSWLADDALANDRYFVTNSHCGALSQSNPNFAMHHPTIGDGGGLEVLDPPWLTFETAPGVCPSPRICRHSDAALFRHVVSGQSNPEQSNHGYVALPPVNSGTVFSNYVPITDVIAPVVGYAIYKVGRTTGRQGGLITKSCANTVVTENGIPTNKWYLCQGEESSWTLDGDSGGPIMEIFGDGTAWAVGIHWGSGGAFSPMDNILYEFYYAAGSVGSLDPTTNLTTPPPPPPSPPPAPPTVTISGQSTVRPNVTCVWTAVVTGAGPFTYGWTQNGAPISGGIEVTTSFSSSGTLAVTVFDSYGQPDRRRNQLRFPRAHSTACAEAEESVGLEA